ncbi:MAG: MBL fold metallo-hydrolase [Pyrinomonadaceae bacterium]|nr:MBL fold metallo-hydrolase [Pyrinomonadaceae bacterium]
MYFKQFYLGCLAHASYIIGSEGEAAVVDPQRDVDQYLEDAAAHNLKIKYVIETHLHADFVSGHRELAARTGATIVFGAKAEATFPHRAVKEGDELRVGEVVLRVLETPGHTPESISILVIDPKISAQPQKVLTGDCLFVGDVGRPDLAGGKGYTPQMMAGMMYDTLHQKMLQLPDETEVYPAHGAGSMCGRNMSKETWSTIGEQRKVNYALKPMSKDKFVTMMTSEMPDAPAYFSKDAEINRTGANRLSEIARPTALSPQEVKDRIAAGNTVLDVRGAAEFGEGHVPSSLNIGLGGQFAIWAATLIPMGAPIVIVAESEEKVDEAIMRLARVGLESVKGYLRGGIDAWRAEGLKSARVPQITVEDLHSLAAKESELQVLDVRRPAEFESGHVPHAVPVELLKLEQTNLALDLAKPTAVICAGGYRSSAATSILEQRGFMNLLNVTGGTGAWIKAGYPVEMPT